MNIHELEKVLEKISGKLEEGKKLVSEDKIFEFQSAAKEITTQIEGIMEEGRVLRLGIVGEVKAGKSSFLNAMLFDGKDILPKAPTPMTAALTRIGYSDIPKGKIVFYNKNDWDAIVERSRKYDEQLEESYNEYRHSLEMEELERRSRIKNGLRKENQKKVRPLDFLSIEEFEKENRDSFPLEYRACKEVCEMAEENGIHVSDYLGREEIFEGDTVDEFGYLEKLKEYVGADGKFTPIVKYTEIQICNEMLKGVEVIDTPGLNDPIYSRSRTTKKFLIECDAVFLLGYGGQFLGAEDMNFLLSSLPDEGIKQAVLIASKFDSMIQQYPKKDASFKKAYIGSKRNCEESARTNIENCTVNRHNAEVLEQIKKSFPPKCVSSLAYSAARKLEDGKPYDAYEQLMVSNLERRFPDFNGNYDTLMGLSSIPDVREIVFEETKANKDQIIEERIVSIVDSQVIKFRGNLEDILRQAERTRNDLEKYDRDQLQEQLQNMQEKLDSIRIIVKNLFEKVAIESKRTINDMAVDLKRETENHLDIEVQRKTETKHHCSTSGWWIFSSDHHWDEIINTNIVEIRDVDQNIRAYRNRAEETIHSGFRNLLKIEDLKNGIKEVVMGAFEESDKDFDEMRILSPLETALGRITLPEVNVDLEKYEKMLDSMIGKIATNGMVLNDNIPELKRSQDKIISKLADDYVGQMKKQGEKISLDLQKQATDFVDTIITDLKKNVEKVKKLLEEKQSGIDKIENFITEIVDAEKMLNAVGV